MGRVAYAILAALLLGLLWYLFRPDAQVEAQVAVLSGAPPQQYRLHTPDLDQDIDHQQVVLHGLRRPLDIAKVDAWWGYLRQLTAPQRLVVPGIAETQLTAYGIDGSRELNGTALRLRWGEAGGKGYLWDGVNGRIFACAPSVVRHLDSLAVRLDRSALIDAENLSRLALTRGPLVTTAVDRGGEWFDEVHQERPPLTPRMQLVVVLLSALRLDEFGTAAPAGIPDIGELRLSHGDGALALEQRVRLWSAGSGGLVQVDDLPAQALSLAAARTWRDALADLERDYVADLRREFNVSPLTELLVLKAGSLQFRLEKHGLRDVADGLSQWDVVWPTGREIAGADAAGRIAYALDTLAVSGARRGAKDEQPPADATVLDFVFQIDLRHERIAISGSPGAWQLWGPTHRGQVAELPPLLAHLEAAAMLDLSLIDRPWSQVVKIQRIAHGGGQQAAEVFAVDSGGSWRQSFPAGARARQVDQLAIEQLARAACAVRAQSARFVTAADRSVIDDAEFELDLRFLPRQVRHSSDTARLDETTDQDLGFCFRREGDGWRAVNREAGVSYLLGADAVDLLRVPVEDNLVMPLVPSLVQRIEVATPSGHYQLGEEAGTWTAHVIDGERNLGPPLAADAVEVRRLLRRLAGLRAARIEAKAAPLTAKEAAATVICEQSVGTVKEIITLSIGAPAAAGGEVVLSAETTATSRHPPPGRCYLPGSAAALLGELAPPLPRLLGAPGPMVGP
jgi:hypothetical protein